MELQKKSYPSVAQDKQEVANEIDKFFRSYSFRAKEHLDLKVIRPDDGFEIEGLRKVQIDSQSIDLLQETADGKQYLFAASAEIEYVDPLSHIPQFRKGNLGGNALLRTFDGRDYVVMLTITSLS